MSKNVTDPVRETLKNILDLTGDLVKQLREARDDQQARSIIVWVATCLHIILGEEAKALRTESFFPHNSEKTLL